MFYWISRKSWEECLFSAPTKAVVLSSYEKSYFSLWIAISKFLPKDRKDGDVWYEQLIFGWLMFHNFSTRSSIFQPIQIHNPYRLIFLSNKNIYHFNISPITNPKGRRSTPLQKGYRSPCFYEYIRILISSA